MVQSCVKVFYSVRIYNKYLTTTLICLNSVLSESFFHIFRKFHAGFIEQSRPNATRALYRVTYVVQVTSLKIANFFLVFC